MRTRKFHTCSSAEIPAFLTTRCCSSTTATGLITAPLSVKSAKAWWHSAHHMYVCQTLFAHAQSFPFFFTTVYYCQEDMDNYLCSLHHYTTGSFQLLFIVTIFEFTISDLSPLRIMAYHDIHMINHATGSHFRTLDKSIREVRSRAPDVNWWLRSLYYMTYKI